VQLYKDFSSLTTLPLLSGTQTAWREPLVGCVDLLKLRGCTDVGYRRSDIDSSWDHLIGCLSLEGLTRFLLSFLLPSSCCSFFTATVYGTVLPVGRFCYESPYTTAALLGNWRVEVAPFFLHPSIIDRHFRHNGCCNALTAFSCLLLVLHPQPIFFFRPQSSSSLLWSHTICCWISPGLLIGFKFQLRRIISSSFSFAALHSHLLLCFFSAFFSHPLPLPDVLSQILLKPLNVQKVLLSQKRDKTLPDRCPYFAACRTSSYFLPWVMIPLLLD
jgi:hypothetical protein